jgi:hypothetical protein
MQPITKEISPNSCCYLSIRACLYISRQPERSPVHWLKSVTITTLLTDGVFLRLSLYVAVVGVVLVGGILLPVVSGLGAVMKTPYYQQEVQVQAWGDKNATKRSKFPVSGTLWCSLMEH